MTKSGDPYCTVCMNDRGLVVVDYVPAHEETEMIRAHQGTFPKSRRIGPSVRYHCTQCGNAGQVDVSEDYQPSA